LPEFLNQHSVLRKFHEKASVVLHGSTMRGIDDPFSDLDLLFLQQDDNLCALDAVSGTRFFEFEVDGKPGHLNAENVDDWAHRLRTCDLERISEMRSAEAIMDNTGVAGELISLARKPMRRAVSRAFFFHHYVEMRSCHRACDNPMERKDPVAVLLSVTRTLAQALRAALVLDGQPYPYEKWLHNMAIQTPTGGLLAPRIETILNLFAADALRHEGSQLNNPVCRELMGIRAILIEAANAKGICEPWLGKWYLHITQAKNAVKDIRW